MLGKPSKRTRKHLDEHGRLAQAEVLEIALKTKLRVRPEGEPEFEVETKLRFPQTYEPDVGEEIEVIYDPEDHDRLMLGRYEPHGAKLDEGTKKTAQGWLNAYGQGGAAQSLDSAPGAPIESSRNTGAISGAGMTTGVTREDAVDPNAQMMELATQLQKGEITMEQFEAEQKKLFGG